MQKYDEKMMGIGVSLRQPHYAEFLQDSPPNIPFLEIISDHVMFSHGLLRDKILKIRERYPMVMHGTGLNVGSMDPINQEYLSALKECADIIQPAWLSDHLCWTGVAGQHSFDLLPLPYTNEALEHVIARIQIVQDFLQRPLLIENVSSYLQIPHADFSEAEFINEVAQQSGCGILLDVNNVFVSASNHDFIAEDYLATLAPHHVKQFHLAGYEQLNDILIDTHGAAISPPVWQLYSKALAKFGRIPTIIEWDNNIPDWSVMQSQVIQAKVHYDAS